MLLLKKAGLGLAEYGIQVFAFVPDPTGYVVVLHKTDGSLTRCAWHNVPRELDSVLEREAPKGVRHVTVGVDGSYAVILNSGAVWWGSNVPARLHQLLEDAERKNRPVAVSIISMIARRVGAHLLLFLGCIFQRPSPSPSSRPAGILSSSKTGLRISLSLRAGTTQSTTIPLKPCA